jgi:hypothetical protein
MNPPFFPAINVSAVWAVFGSNPVRVFPFGEAPKDTGKPYAVWQTVNGRPYNYLNEVPDGDDWLVQVDVYVESESPATAINQVTEGARVLRDALEPVAHITAWRGASREPTTKFYRYSFDVSFVTSR